MKSRLVACRRIPHSTATHIYLFLSIWLLPSHLEYYSWQSGQIFMLHNQDGSPGVQDSSRGHLTWKSINTYYNGVRGLCIHAPVQINQGSPQHIASIRATHERRHTAGHSYQPLVGLRTFTSGRRSFAAPSAHNPLLPCLPLGPPDHSQLNWANSKHRPFIAAEDTPRQ